MVRTTSVKGSSPQPAANHAHTNIGPKVHRKARATGDRYSTRAQRVGGTAARVGSLNVVSSTR